MPAEKYDTFHDYRPDPEFRVESRLYNNVTDSFDESGLFNEELEAIISKGECLLDDFHDKFYEEFLSGLGAQYAELQPEEGEEGDEGDEAVIWTDINPEAQIALIRRLPWDRLIKNLAVHFDGTEEDMTPDNAADWYAGYVNFFPYLECVYRKLPDYFMVKDYFLEIKSTSVNYVSRTLTDIAEEKEDMEKAKEEVQPIGKKIMWGLIAFRNTYLNFMFKTLRDGGMSITHKMAGSIDITSDYDTTFGGPDDVAAACEFYRAFRAEWLAEPGTIFDANVYCRDWMTVDDQTLHPSVKGNKDASLQVLVLEFMGDMYSLTKIRRHSSKVEWAAFNNAVLRHISVESLDAPDLAEVNNTRMLQGSGLPLFKRFDKVDEIYREQFVKPLLTRAGDIWEDFKEDMRDKLGDKVDKATPRTMERLFEYDKDGMLRAMTIAYLELTAKLRKVEVDLKKDYPGDFRWYQNDATAEGKGALKDYKEINPGGTGLSAEGMALFLERSSVLMSESVLFAIEPYFTQGAVWSVVGSGQSGLIELKHSTTMYHRLQCFNEQIGDALKELREHLREMEHDEAEKTSNLRMNELWEQLAATEEGPAYEAARVEYEAEWLKYDQIQKSIKDEQTGTGFYRASKYEERLVVELTRIIENLNTDPVIAKRKTVHDKLFPGLPPEQELNFECLKLELKIGKIFEDNVKELKAIRKGKKGKEKDYGTMTNEEKIQEAIKLVDEIVNEDSDFNKLVNDPLRENAEIDYVAASPKGRMNKYTPRPLPGEDKNTWGLRHLIHHLFWHGAAVNRNVRLLLSRGPLEITVKNIAVDDDSEEDGSPSDDSPPDPSEARKQGISTL